MTRAGRRQGHEETVALVGFLGTGNLGNDVSLSVVVEAIRRLRPDTRLRVIAFGHQRGQPVNLPTTTLDLERTTRVNRLSHRADRALVKTTDALSMVRALRRTQHLIVPGSGILEERLGGSAWGFPWALAASVAAARVTRTRVHLVCIGADRPTDPGIRLFFRLVSRWATTRSFRDEMSRELVRQLGVDTAADPVVADLAFARTPPAQMASPVRGHIGLGVLAWFGPHDHRSRGQDDHRTYVDAIGRLATRLLEEDLAVTLLVGDGIDETVFAPVRAVVAEHGQDPEAICTHVSPTFDELVQTMSGIDVVVGSRFHNIVGAAVAARPIISLGYGPKHRELMEDLGLGTHAHSIDHIDVEMVLEEILDIMGDRAGTSRSLRLAAQQRSAAVAAYLEELIGSWRPPQRVTHGARS